MENFGQKGGPKTDFEIAPLLLTGTPRAVRERAPGSPLGEGRAKRTAKRDFEKKVVLFMTPPYLKSACKTRFWGAWETGN